MITNKGCKRLRDLEKKVDSGSVGGNDVFRVTMVYNELDREYYTDKTYGETKEAFDAGKLVIIDNYGTVKRDFIFGMAYNEEAPSGKRYMAFILTNDEYYYAAESQNDYMKYYSNMA